MSNFNSQRNKAIAQSYRTLITGANDPAIQAAINKQGSFILDGTGETIDENIAYLNRYFNLLADYAGNDVINEQTQSNINATEKLIDETIAKIESGFTEYKKTHTKYDMEEYKKYSFMTDVIQEYKDSKAQLLEHDGYNAEKIQKQYNSVEANYHEEIDKYLIDKFNDYKNFFENPNTDKAVFEDIIEKHTGKKSLTPEEYIALENRDELSKDLNDTISEIQQSLNEEAQLLINEKNTAKQAQDQELADLETEYREKLNANDAKFEEQIQSYARQKEEAIKNYSENIDPVYKENFVYGKQELFDIVNSGVSQKYRNMGLPLEDINADPFEWVTKTEDQEALLERRTLLRNLEDELTKKQTELNKDLETQNNRVQKMTQELDKFKETLGDVYPLFEKYIYSKNTPQPEKPHYKTAEELEEDQRRFEVKNKIYEMQLEKAKTNTRSYNMTILGANQHLLDDTSILADRDYLTNTRPEEVIAMLEEKAKEHAMPVNYPPNSDAFLKECELPEKPVVNVEADDPRIGAYEADKALRITKKEKKILDEAAYKALDNYPKFKELKTQSENLKKEIDEANANADKYENLSFANYSEKDLAKLYPLIENTNISKDYVDKKYSEYKDALKKRNDASKVIKSNTGWVNKTYPMDKLADSVKTLNEYILDEKNQELIESVGENIGSGLFFNAIETIQNNNYKIDNPDTYAAAGQILSEYSNVVKNINNIEDPKADELKKQMLNILKPMEEISKNEKLVSALNEYNKDLPSGSEIFQTIADKYNDQSIASVEKLNDLDKKIKLVQDKFLDGISEYPQKIKDATEKQIEISKELNQVNKDLSFSQNAQGLISSKYVWLGKELDLKKTHGDKVLEFSNKEEQSKQEKHQAAVPIYNEKIQKQEEITKKYEDQINASGEASLQKQGEYQHQIDNLRNLTSTFSSLNRAEETVIDEQKKVNDIQKRIDRLTQQATQEFKDTKAKTYNKLNEKEDKAMDAVINSKKKYGFNSSKFTDVVDAINEYKASRAQSNGELTEAIFNEQTKKLYEKLNEYIETRKEDKGKTKSTPEGQQRLDAMRKLKQQLDVKKQKIKDFDAEEKTIKAPTDIKLKVGSEFESIIAKKNFPDLKNNVDKTIYERVNEKEIEPEVAQNNINKKQQPNALSDSINNFLKTDAGKKAIKEELMGDVNFALDKMKNENDRSYVNVVVSALIISQDKEFKNYTMGGISKEFEAYRKTPSVNKLTDALLDGDTNIEGLANGLQDPDAVNKIKTEATNQKLADLYNRNNPPQMHM